MQLTPFLSGGRQHSYCSTLFTNFYSFLILVRKSIFKNITGMEWVSHAIINTKWLTLVSSYFIIYSLPWQHLYCYGTACIR